MYVNILLILFLLGSTHSFVPNFFRNTKPFYKQDNHIELINNNKIFDKFSGFYGLVGPNVDFYNVTSLFELFTGNGVIQGVFIDNGNITFTNHIINTERYKFEKKFGRKILINLGTLILNTFNMMPISTGTANTALCNVKNKTLALYETDQPYHMKVDFYNKTISTLEKIKIKGISSFSGHTKIKTNTIETTSYDILKKTIEFITLDHDLNVLSKLKLKTKYMPVIHDFLSDDNYFIIFDSPLEFDVKRLFQTSFPVYLNHNKPTYIHILNKKTGETETFSIDEGFYTFHFSKFIDKKDHFVIQSTQVDELDFTNLNFYARLREVRINKETKKAENKKFPHLEKISIDFPLKINNKQTLFSLIEHKKGFVGFVICENTKIIKKIKLKDTVIVGEAQIISLLNTPYLICFTKKNDKNYLMLMNLKTFSSYDVPIPIKITNGFHSLFIKN